MPRGKGTKYLEARRTLIHRIGSACFTPGAKFMTTRSVCTEFSMCIQSAHDLLSDLVAEGYLERRSTAGTFIPGSSVRYKRVQLVFYPKARNPKSFGGILRQRLVGRLKEQGVPFNLRWTDRWERASADDYLVLWATDDRSEREQAALRRRGLLLNATPGSLVSARYFDSISMDNFTSGFFAGQIIRQQSRFERVAILANPYGRDVWAEQCVLGFRSIWPRARLVHPQAWGPRALSEIVEGPSLQHCDAICCCNQYNALNLLNFFTKRQRPVPYMIAVDRTPMVPNFPIPLISFSVDELVETALRIIRARLNGDPSTPSHITLAPRLYSPI